MPKRKGIDGDVGDETVGKKIATENTENGTSTDDGNNHEDGNGLSSDEKNEVDKDVNRLSIDGSAPTLKICSWNVAGLRAALKKDALKYINEQDADIVCLQETKIVEKEIPGEVLALKKGGKIFDKGDDVGYHMYLNPAVQKGYSGVALWSKKKPVNVKYGMGIKEHDKDGRLITAEYETFYLLTSYVPNAGKKLVNLAYRREWNTALRNYINDLNAIKPVIFCGDLNVAHHEIDLKNPKGNRKNAGFSDEEREDFSALLDDGYIDTFRHLYPDLTDAYTFWTYMSNARAKNVGWRLDYFLIAESLTNKLCNNIIRSDVMGSDHCPIVLTMAI